MFLSTLKNIFTLVSGNVIARIATFLLTPVLARLYTPEDFGVLAIYGSILGPLAVICTGRYSLAVFLPKKDEDALDLITLCLIISLILTAVLFLPLGIFLPQISEFFSISESRYLLLLIPISLIFSAAYQAFTVYFNRIKRYRLISTVLVTQSVSTCLTQILFGWMGWKANGLVWGFFIGSALSGTIFYLCGPKLKLRTDNVKVLAKKYSKYPLISTWSALLDSVAIQVPIWLITKAYAPEMVGAFSFTFKVINAPLGIISGSIGQILHQKVADLYREKSAETSRLITQFLFVLIGLSIPVVVICFFWGEELFTFVFGDKWKIAGQLVSVAVFAFVIRFIVSPLTSILALDNHLNKGVAWQVLYFISTSVVLYLGSKYSFDIFLKVFVVHEIVLYGIYLGIVYYAARIDSSGPQSVEEDKRANVD